MIYVIAEIGLNHNGSLTTALDMIKAAHDSGCNAVKFQKRTPKVCVPHDQWNIERDTPWGRMSYIDYREKMEFGKEEYDEIDSYCAELGIDWSASVWDLDSLAFIMRYNIPFIKIPSAMLTNWQLIDEAPIYGREVIISTGMSTIEEIDAAVNHLKGNCTVMHCTSTYPCPPEELNLRMIPALLSRYNIKVGYSGHEVGLQTTIAAVALGATVIERHFTLDRSMWGTDQAASVEPQGMTKLVRDIRVLEKALGDGIKRVYKSEEPSRERLRGIQGKLKDNIHCR